MATTWEAVIVAVTPRSAGAPTLTEICPIPWSALTIRDELGGDGLATIKGPADKLDPNGKARLLNLTTTCSELWVRRNTSTTSTLAFAGPITGVSVQNRVVTITANGLLGYLAYAIQSADYDGSGQDIVTILKALIDARQTLAYGNDGFDTTLLTPAGVTVSAWTVAGREMKTLRALATDLGNRGSGFDLWVDPTTRRIQAASPRRGTDRSANIVLDQRSISPNGPIGWSAAPGVVGSEMYSVGSSANGTNLVGTPQSNLTVRASFGRADIGRTFSNVADQATLDDMAARALADAQTQAFVVSPEILPVAGFSYGDFAVGDIIGYDYDAGLGRQTFTCRVSTIETVVDSGSEVLRVGIL